MTFKFISCIWILFLSKSATGQTNHTIEHLHNILNINYHYQKTTVCQRDIDIIDQLQSNQIETENVAIFIDKFFYRMEYQFDVFKLLVSKKVYFVYRLDSSVDVNNDENIVFRLR